MQIVQMLLCMYHEYIIVRILHLTYNVLFQSLLYMPITSFYTVLPTFLLLLYLTMLLYQAVSSTCV